MARYAIIRIIDGLVTNVTEWDGGPQWSPPSGHEARQSNVAGPGDTWNGLSFIKLNSLPTPDQIEDIAQMPLVAAAETFRDRTDYLTEPSFTSLPALSGTATAAQTRDYIIANVIPRINALSTGANAAVPRINVLMQAVQSIIKVLLYLGKRLMGLTSG